MSDCPGAGHVFLHDDVHLYIHASFPTVCARKGDGPTSALFSITGSGRIYRHTAVSSGLGIDLDSRGRVQFIHPPGQAVYHSSRRPMRLNELLMIFRKSREGGDLFVALKTPPPHQPFCIVCISRSGINPTHGFISRWRECHEMLTSDNDWRICESETGIGTGE